METYHINDAGEVHPCSAKIKCGFSGAHYSTPELARAAYELTQNHKTLTTFKKSKKTEVFEGEFSLDFKKRYGRLVLDTSVVERSIEIFKSLVGQEKFDLLTAAKAQRDGENAYHMTILAPKEFRTLAKSLGNIPHKAFTSFELMGVGNAVKDNASAYYAIANFPQAQAYRKSLDLPPADLHVTLGFFPTDVHGVSKDETTLLS